MRTSAGKNLTYSIVEELGQAIVTDTYSGSRAFPIEIDLCKQFGASRSVVREAVKMLTAKGLLSARPRQGTVLEPEERWNLLDPDVLRWMLERKFSLPLLSELTEVRLAIEPMAARMAARHATPEALAQLHRAIDRMKAAEKGEDDPLASDIAFHVAVLHASANRFYKQFEAFIGTALRISIRLTNQLKGVPMANVNDHRKVLHAIETGDAQKAQSAMDALLREVVSLIEKAGKRGRAEKGS